MEFDMAVTMASLRHIVMGRNGDYFLDYIDYSKNFDVVLKLLLVILGNHRNYCSKQCMYLRYYYLKYMTINDHQNGW